MNDYKSIQDLIVKAALYDGVSTTIRPHPLFKEYNALELTFSRDGMCSATYIDMHDVREDMILYCAKRALRNLLFAPYENIEVNKEN